MCACRAARLSLARVEMMNQVFLSLECRECLMLYGYLRTFLFDTYLVYRSFFK
jgi:hypothetical protein